jgi:hypothetical protein
MISCRCRFRLAPVALSLVLLASACSSAEPGRKPEAAKPSEGDSRTDFLITMELECVEWRKAEYDVGKTYRSPGTSRLRAAGRALGDLVEAASAIEPPASLKRSFDRYVTLLGEQAEILTTLPPVEGNRRTLLKRMVKNTGLAVKAGEIGDDMGLTHNCPPQEDVLGLFAWKGNLICFDSNRRFGTIDKILDISSADQLTGAFEVARDNMSRLASDLEQAVPPKLNDPRVKPFIGSFRELAASLEAARQKLAAFDSDGYLAETDRLERISRKLGRQGESLFLYDCLRAI